MQTAHLVGAGVAIALALAPCPASSQVAPAPEGDAVMVAQNAISTNFKKSVCPLVEAAERLLDGSIRAKCNNNETFRIFSAGPKRIVLAMRCSAAARMGLQGCEGAER